MLGRRNRRSQPTVYDRLFRYGEFLGFGELHIKIDKATGLRAIVAIHNTSRGPAIGGCRCIHYKTSEEALEDVLRLAQLMSYKAAVHNLPHGGAKAVIIAPDHIHDRKAFFEAFGEFVHGFNGRYITAEDSGTTPDDMDIIAKKTPYVMGTTTQSGGFGDPSPYTAHGVCRGIEAAVKFKLNRNDLSSIRVAIQGTGHVGYHLAKKLHQRGAKLTVCDMDQASALRCVQEFGATLVEPDAIYSVDCDVFAPCALGSILNLKHINQLTAPIVAGAANNQLAHHHHGQLLTERGILYAPDFVINAGGLMHVVSAYSFHDLKIGDQQIENIYQTLLMMFEKAKAEQRPVNVIAEQIAEENMGIKNPKARQ